MVHDLQGRILSKDDVPHAQHVVKPKFAAEKKANPAHEKDLRDDVNGLKVLCKFGVYFRQHFFKNPSAAVNNGVLTRVWKRRTWFVESFCASHHLAEESKGVVLDTFGIEDYSYRGILT